MWLYNLEFTFNMKDINNLTQPKILKNSSFNKLNVFIACASNKNDT